jgi:acyl dehydratase
VMPGQWFEQFEVGQHVQHQARAHVTQDDNAAFCRLTRNTQPLHLDEAWAKAHSPFGRIVVNGLYTFALAVGASVPELTEGTLVANLAYHDVEHPKPVFPGDELRVTTEVLGKRPTSKPDRGIVTLQSRVFNQRDEEVCTFRRVVLVLRDPEAL